MQSNKTVKGRNVTTTFDLPYQVQEKDIDVLGHVNNVVYVQWMQDIATAHVDSLGLGLKQYLELKHAMVAVEHQVQYRKAALLGEHLILRTWLSDLNALYSTRQYVFFRPSDQSIIFTGQTKWACVEIATGRPKRLSPSFTQAYQPLNDTADALNFTAYQGD
ncbi:acyl-CoA thioesterase [Acinetobacter rudis]|uniref:Acyl-CoA thioesterase n=1 Tax=Acinetobacter rudis TaxID=632955 RepID=A0AAW8J9G7_9GAMM|nr:acyl-CoA thioesterase [Acinetobacter rudis]MDQ8935702.1 acyl-CoA thioesterase [Acinetobacter rudis]MDQ8952026.1 acyl-CoA thioesterase [Acinetobacter rudis]MDQ9017965.1 acyl-CoA thioesterase [Acinetobacter rudis]